MKQRKIETRVRPILGLLAGVLVLIAAPASALDSGGWREIAVLGSPTPEVGSQFGSGLALTTEHLLVGQRFASPGDSVLQGSAHLFDVLPDGMVKMSLTLLAEDGAEDDRFGAAVAIRDDLVVIGSQRADIDAMQWRGALYVFNPDGQGLWSQTAKLVAPDGQTFDEFGTTVATDGTTILGGTPQGDGAIADQGSAYHYALQDGGLWQFTGKLADPAGKSADQFASTLDLAGDVALIGAPRATVGDNAFQGIAQVWQFTDGMWQLTATLLAQDGQAFDGFGTAVALAGEQALIGASAADEGGLNNRGAVYVFDRLSDGTWSQRQKLLAEDGGDDDLFGSALAIADSRAVASAPQASGSTERSGAAYILDRQLTGDWTVSARLSAADGQPFSAFGRRAAIAGELVAIAAPNSADGAVNDAGRVHIFRAQPLPAAVAVPTLEGGALALLILSLLLTAGRRSSRF